MLVAKPRPKTAVGATPPRVRTPVSPPESQLIKVFGNLDIRVFKALSQIVQMLALIDHKDIVREYVRLRFRRLSL